MRRAHLTRRGRSACCARIPALTTTPPVSLREESATRGKERRECLCDRRAHICGLTTLCSRATAPTPPMLVVILSGDRRDSRHRLLPRWPRSLPACAERLRTHRRWGRRSDSDACRANGGVSVARGGSDGQARPPSSIEQLGTRRAWRRGTVGRHGWCSPLGWASCPHA